MDRREQVRDEWLVLECQTGNRTAFEHLVKRWQERLWRHAYRLTGNEAAAWDVLQDSWMAITQALGRLTDPARFRPWAYTIVTRQAANHRRRAGKEEPVEDANAIVAPAAGDSGEEPVERLRAALQRLPGDQRALLALKYQEGFELTEIARILGIPEGTVKSRLHHARQHLREITERMEP